VVLEGLDGHGQAGDLFGAGTAGEGRCVDDEGIDVIKMRVSDEKCLEQVEVDGSGVLDGVGRLQLEAGKGPILEDVRERQTGEIRGLGLLEDLKDGCEVDASIDGDERAPLPLCG
jgi:hypothetical protein